MVSELDLDQPGCNPTAWTFKVASWLMKGDGEESDPSNIFLAWDVQARNECGHLWVMPVKNEESAKHFVEEFNLQSQQGTFVIDDRFCQYY